MMTPASHVDLVRFERHLVSVRVAAKMAEIPIRTLYLWIKERRLTCEGDGVKRVDWDEVCQLAELRLTTARLPRLDRSI